MKNLICLFLLFSSVSVIGQSNVRFEVVGINPDYTGNVGIRGNVAPLSWDRSISMNPTEGGFVVDISFLEGNRELEFKFVLYTDDATPDWENTPNRKLFLKSGSDKLSSLNTWNTEQVLDISSFEPIPSNLLLEDYALIETLVLDIHPGTYRYNSEEEIRAALNELKKEFASNLSYQDAYLAVSEMMATVQCDHTRAGFNNQTQIINSIIHSQPDKLPFTFKWVDYAMIVTFNASEDERLTRGSEVIAINGVSTADIRNRMMPYISADGATDGNRLYKMEINGYDFRYNAFDVFYPLLYPISGETVRLDLLYADGKEGSIEVETLTREDRFEKLADRYPGFPKTRDDMWNFTISNDEVAVLTLNSFGLMGWKAMTIDYKAFLADAFDQIHQKGINHLVIDIRENTGGNDEMAEELYSYLLPETKPFEREGRTRYKTFPESLKPYVKTWGDNPWYFNLKPKEEKTPEGYYVFKENFNGKKGKNKKERYEGKVYLLTSSANTSLAFYTAYRFRYENLGPLVGQETGGNLNDINGGQILFLTLPNSQIEIDFPVMGGFSTTPQPNMGVIPDYPVFHSKETLLEGRDLEMEKVMELIAGE